MLLVLQNQLGRSHGDPQLKLTIQKENQPVYLVVHNFYMNKTNQYNTQYSV